MVVMVVEALSLVVTGSPFPFWHIEELDAPVAVQSCTKTRLILEDGSEVSLPFIEEIPHESPLFLAALSDGIEVSTSGEAFGLMWVDRVCGRDPVLWYKRRINLSHLAGALHPGGIDRSLVHPEAVAFLEQNCINLLERNQSHRKGNLTAFDLNDLRKFGRQYEYSAQTAEAGRRGRAE
jgi:hypothetical protein